MTTETHENNELVQVLKAALGDALKAVVLFGSRARGDAAPNSDWDVLLVVAGLPANPFQRRMYIKQRIPSVWRGRLAIIVYSPTEFSNHVSSLLFGIANDGIILHDRDGLAERRIARLRADIHRSGAVRERTAAGEIWHGISPGAWNALLGVTEAKP